MAEVEEEGGRWGEEATEERPEERPEVEKE